MKDILSRYNFPKVSEFMTKKVISFTPDQNSLDVVKYFNTHHISAAPVLDPSDSTKLIGFITEKDCMELIANGSFFDECIETPIDTYMTKNVITVSDQMDIFEVESLFRAHGIGHAPVVDKNGHLVGILGRRDILLAFEQVLDRINLFKEEYNVPPKELGETQELILRLNR